MRDFTAKTPAPRPIVPFTYTVYDGKELKRNAGIPDSRFRAYELPSLQGGKRIIPNR